MKRNVLSLILALSLATTLMVPCLKPVNAAEMSLANDPAEYGGWMDAKDMFIDMNSTHTTLTLTHYGSMPNNANHYWSTNIYFDIDQSNGTGSIYSDWKMGVDYYFYTYAYGDGTSTYASIYRWNASTSNFNWVDPPPDFMMLFTPGEDHFSVICPLSAIGLSVNSNFYAKAESYAYANDYGQNFLYSVAEGTDILVDGNPGDWGGSSYKFLDPADVQPPEFDMSGFYTTNNSTHLSQRFDVAGSFITITAPDISLYGRMYVYYDTDNNASTGYSIGGIGAEYRSRVNFGVDQYGRSKYGYLYWYNQTSGSFVNIAGLVVGWNSVYEWSFALSLMGVSTGGLIQIRVDYMYGSVFDRVPDGFGKAFYAGAPTLSQSFIFTGGSVRMIYPSDNPAKPLGCSAAMVSDWLASAFVSSKLGSFTEGLDTESDFVNQVSGKPLGGVGSGIVSFGGPFVNPVVKYAEGDGTPATDRAPIKFHSEGGVFYFLHRNGTSISGASLPLAVINANQDMFVIEAYKDTDSRYMMLCYGFGWKGTYAAGKFYDQVIFLNPNSYQVSWIIVKWDDTDGNGFVNNPGDGDTYTAIASGK